MTDLLLPLMVAAEVLRGRLTHRWTERRHDHGLGTLETVIITLGLITVAALAVAAINAAVTSRTDKIK